MKRLKKVERRLLEMVPDPEAYDGHEHDGHANDTSVEFWGESKASSLNSAMTSLDELGCVKRVEPRKQPEPKQLDWTVEQAMQFLLDQLEFVPALFKVHSHEQGEYVQCSEFALVGTERARILFLRALAELVHNGSLNLVSDNYWHATFMLSERRRANRDI